MLNLKFINKKVYHYVCVFLAVTLYLVLTACAVYLFTLLSTVEEGKKSSEQKLSTLEKTYIALKNEDQYKRNETLQEEIKQINATYKNALSAYEKIQDLKAQKQDTVDLDKLYASILSNLSEKNYTSASAVLITLQKDIDKKVSTLASTSSGTGMSNAPVSNTAPGSGFSSQRVQTDKGTFTVSLVAADLNSTRVIVDTASESDCGNDCPALSLADYVSRNGAFAGINGSFFCPPEYPTCAGKTNSFDTLLMNKNKKYFNSDNNKYSTVPLVFFSGNSMGVRIQSLQWGRDTGVDAVIANFPLYVEGGQNKFGGSSDAKITSKGARTFVGNKGSTAYIGIIYGASAEDAALVLTTLKFDNALGMDQGGSTALWHGGYKAGPGRNIPNAILFVKK